MAIPTEPPTCCKRLFIDVAVAVWPALMAFSSDVETGETSKLMPNPRIAIASIINQMWLSEFIKANSAIEIAIITMPTTDGFLITPLSASLPAYGLNNSIINALGNNNRPVSISE